MDADQHATIAGKIEALRDPLGWPAPRPEKSEEMREIEREIRAHNLHADAVLLRKQRRAWKRSRPKL
jgi:hypothetical protein